MSKRAKTITHARLSLTNFVFYLNEWFVIWLSDIIYVRLTIMQLNYQVKDITDKNRLKQYIYIYIYISTYIVHVQVSHKNKSLKWQVKYFVLFDTNLRKLQRVRVIFMFNDREERERERERLKNEKANRSWDLQEER